MIFGVVIRPIMLVAGGLVLLLVTAFQMLQGYRKIKFKGRTHLKVHKASAWTLLVLGLLHGFMGIVYAFGWRIG